MENAEGTDGVLDAPKSVVHFLAFGDSSLDFELLAWVAEVAHGPRVTDRLNRASNAAFKQHSIEIPFPQRVVHMPDRATA